MISLEISLIKEPPYPVFAYGMWMLFENRSKYLDWCDKILERVE